MEEPHQKLILNNFIHILFFYYNSNSVKPWELNNKMYYKVHIVVQKGLWHSVKSWLKTTAGLQKEHF